MKRFLLMVCGLLLLGMAAADAIWPAIPQTLIDERQDHGTK